MFIKGNHRIWAFMMLEMLFIAGLVYLIITYNLYNSSNKYNSSTFVLVLCLCLIAQLFTLYSIAFEKKTYYVCKDGIIINWLGIKQLMKWSDIRYVRIITIRISGWQPIEHMAFVCTKVPLKTYSITEDNTYDVVDYDWCLLRPNKVVGIHIDDLKPGQYEEFWSYVPDRLKGNYNPG